CVLTVVAGCLLAGRPARIAGRLVLATGAAVVAFLTGWLTYAGGGVDGIAPYLSTGWSISSGYSSAMSLPTRLWGLGVASFLLWMILVAGWAVARRRAGALLSLGLLAVPIFVAWKHSVVRQDDHVGVLMLFGLFVTLVMGVHSLAAWPAARVIS